MVKQGCLWAAKSPWHWMPAPERG